MRLLGRLLRYGTAFVTLALYFVTLLTAYGGKVNPLADASPAVWHLAFPFLAPASLAAALVWLVCRARFIPLCGLTTFLLILPQWLLFFPVGRPAGVPRGSVPFTLLTYNVTLGYDLQTPAYPSSRTFNYILHSGADVVCLQEFYTFNIRTHRRDSISPAVTAPLVDSIRKVYPYSVEARRRNEMALSKYPIRSLPTCSVPANPYIFYDAYEVDIRGRRLTVLNLHLTSYNLTRAHKEALRGLRTPDGLKRGLVALRCSVIPQLEKQFKARALAAEVVRRHSMRIAGPLIVCGDFNDIPGSWAWNTIAAAGLRDAYSATSAGPMVTFNADNMPFRIDHILYRGPIRPLRVWRGDIKSSDHYPLFAEFVFDNTGSSENNY